MAFEDLLSPEEQERANLNSRLNDDAPAEPGQTGVFENGRKQPSVAGQEPGVYRDGKNFADEKQRQTDTLSSVDETIGFDPRRNPAGDSLLQVDQAIGFDPLAETQQSGIRLPGSDTHVPFAEAEAALATQAKLAPQLARSDAELQDAREQIATRNARDAATNDRLAGERVGQVARAKQFRDGTKHFNPKIKKLHQAERNATFKRRREGGVRQALRPLDEAGRKWGGGTMRQISADRVGEIFTKANTVLDAIHSGDMAAVPEMTDLEISVLAEDTSTSADFILNTRAQASTEMRKDFTKNLLKFKSKDEMDKWVADAAAANPITGELAMRLANNEYKSNRPMQATFGATRDALIAQNNLVGAAAIDTGIIDDEYDLYAAGAAQPASREQYEEFYYETSRTKNSDGSYTTTKEKRTPAEAKEMEDAWRIREYVRDTSGSYEDMSSDRNEARRDEGHGGAIATKRVESDAVYADEFPEDKEAQDKYLVDAMGGDGYEFGDGSLSTESGDVAAITAEAIASIMRDEWDVNAVVSAIFDNTNGLSEEQFIAMFDDVMDGVDLAEEAQHKEEYEADQAQAMTAMQPELGRLKKIANSISSSDPVMTEVQHLIKPDMGQDEMRDAAKLETHAQVDKLNLSEAGKKSLHSSVDAIGTEEDWIPDEVTLMFDKLLDRVAASSGAQGKAEREQKAKDAVVTAYNAKNGLITMTDWDEDGKRRYSTFDIQGNTERGLKTEIYSDENTSKPIEATFREDDITEMRYWKEFEGGSVSEKHDIMRELNGYRERKEGMTTNVTGVDDIDKRLDADVEREEIHKTTRDGREELNLLGLVLRGNDTVSKTVVGTDGNAKKVQGKADSFFLAEVLGDDEVEAAIAFQFAERAALDRVEMTDNDGNATGKMRYKTPTEFDSFDDYSTYLLGKKGYDDKDVKLAKGWSQMYWNQRNNPRVQALQSSGTPDGMKAAFRAAVAIEKMEVNRNYDRGIVLASRSFGAEPKDTRTLIATAERFATDGRRMIDDGSSSPLEIEERGQKAESALEAWRQQTDRLVAWHESLGMDIDRDSKNPPPQIEKMWAVEAALEKAADAHGVAVSKRRRSDGTIYLPPEIKAEVRAVVSGSSQPEGFYIGTLNPKSGMPTGVSALINSSTGEGVHFWKDGYIQERAKGHAVDEMAKRVYGGFRAALEAPSVNQPDSIDRMRKRAMEREGVSPHVFDKQLAALEKKQANAIREEQERRVGEFMFEQRSKAGIREGKRKQGAEWWAGEEGAE